MNGGWKTGSAGAAGATTNRNRGMPGASAEEYLKAIFKLAHQQQPVTTGRISEHLGVPMASVTGLGVRIGSRVRVVDRAPFAGPIRIHIARKNVTIGVEASKRMLVSRVR